MKSTNYTGTFIQVADDCPAETAEMPPVGKKAPTVAELQYAIISEHPYKFTSDDILFEVHATRRSIPPESKPEARADFFAKDQACLRASPLCKRYGWGIHFDAESRVALVPLGTKDYKSYSADPSLKQVKAIRSKRA